MENIKTRNKLIFVQFPCLSEKKISYTELLSKWKEDQRKKHGRSANFETRYPSELIQKFIRYNKKTFSFLNISALEENANLLLTSNEYVGAVPINSPVDGKPMGDLIITPRFNEEKKGFEQISELFPLVETTIRPEFKDDCLLSSGAVVKPPLYYDSMVFINLMETALKANWRKFQCINKTCNNPGASTQWDKYAITSIDPFKTFLYPNRINDLRKNHKEWQELLVVFDIAVDEINSVKTPLKIKAQVREQVQKITELNSGINRIQTERLIVKASDPLVIKNLKKQGNIILSNNFSESKAWRIDFNLFFERYCQFIFKEIANEIGAKSYSNFSYYAKFLSIRPAWSLSRLEPDIVLSKNDSIINIDAKYKAHMFNMSSSSDSLKESHRDDLHQLFSYNSFDQNRNKMGILIYPHNDIKILQINYSNRINNLTNSTYLIGIPMGLNNVQEIKLSLKDICNNLNKNVT